MSEERKNIIYTAEDIKRYITGTMPAAEMHAMEMAALDDPLLAEAMEGYDLMEQKDWSAELATLKELIVTQKKEETPVVAISQRSSFKWWRSAAAVIILGISAFTAYLFTNKNKTQESQEIAAIKKTVAEPVLNNTADSVRINAGTGALDTAKTFANVTDAGRYKNNFTISTTPSKGVSSYWSTTPQAAKDSAFMYTPSASNPPDIAFNDRRDDKDVSEKQYKTTEPAVASPSSVNANVSNTFSEAKEELFEQRTEQVISSPNANSKEINKNGTYATNTFNGSVVTADNKPVGFANINVPGLKKPVYTDANGNFAFMSADTTLKITVNSAGYSPQKFTLQNTLSNTVVMKPQDITVASIGRAKTQFKKTSRALTDSANIENADEDDTEPSGGWMAYDNYINNNLKLPDNARRNNIHGEVEMTVKLKDNGEISTVQVDKTLSPECDAEAIRLVKEGPKWDVKKKKKKKVKVKVKF